MKCMNLLKVIEEQEETIIRQSEIISAQAKAVRKLTVLLLHHIESKELERVPEMERLKEVMER